ncbi:ACP S-malonyltransferase [Ligilactobacillus salivarius]|uniref:Malonyl CoA-acyl carrier protein transacylase n=1 Tax=Ligilactobacillus salivarius TaxID=1624 RepID=A0A1D7TPC4_9LACO|nr:ACP S-malonyltransferase [Ligilactobacillus salivarius]AOO72795.1 malonyl CoA-ACP transacylase [Ligilactobacillus salivarius]UDE97647.1 ACP S-malonyltransferase [Ligilactobacillus salivarius]UUV96766.1 ACP S-malonyltransferase [Ligilactobacillus salivarius]
MKLAILFSGQGSQFTDMGLDFYQESSIFKDCVDKASEIADFKITSVFANDGDKLSETKYIQPAIVAMSIGIWEMLQNTLGDKLAVEGMVGLSLGEYSALIASQKLSFSDGMLVLKDRAIYMQDDANKVDSKMAAIIDPQIEVIEKLCTDYPNVYVANYNTPKQLVIGGDGEELVDVVDKIDSLNAAKKIVELKVSGAFHTPLFTNASQKMKKRLSNVAFTEGSNLVVSNTTMRPFEKDSLAEILAKQIIKPTHFGECVQYLIDNKKIDTVLEIGPGKTLSKFTKQIDKSIKRYHISKLSNFKKFIDSVKESE